MWCMLLCLAVCIEVRKIDAFGSPYWEPLAKKQPRQNWIKGNGVCADLRHPSTARQRLQLRAAPAASGPGQHPQRFSGQIRGMAITPAGRLLLSTRVYPSPPAPQQFCCNSHHTKTCSTRVLLHVSSLCEGAQQKGWPVLLHSCHPCWTSVCSYQDCKRQVCFLNAGCTVRCVHPSAHQQDTRQRSCF